MPAGPQTPDHEPWQSEAGVRALLQHSWDILSILDGQGRLRYNSPACERIHGFTPEELLGRSTVDLIHPEDAAKVAATMEWILAHPGEPATVEYRYACKDGRWVWMEAVGVNHLDHPAIRGIVANSRDISGRIGAEAALGESEQKFRKLIEAASVPIGIANFEGHIEYLNPRFIQDFAYRPEDLPDLDTWWRRAYPDPAYRERALAAWEEALARASESGGDVSMDPIFEVTCGDGRVRLVKFQGAVAGGRVIVFLQDLTDRVQAEEKLRKASAALDQTPASIMITDTNGVIEYVNSAFTDITGYAFEEAVGENPRMLKSGHHDPAFYKELWTTILGGGTWTGRLRNRRKNGSLYWEEASISPLRNESGVITHFVGSKLDITVEVGAAEAHRSLEEQVARTQRLESLGSLAGGVAHDMNNVLGAILGMATLYGEQAPAGSSLQHGMETITKACQRGATLVKGLLGFARQGLSERKVLDLNALVRDEIALLERTTLQKVSLVTDLAEDLHPVMGDSGALAHALMNLCVNAVDAMPEGGTLRLATRNEGAGDVLLEVSDTGAGMSPAVLEKALDPFFTTKPQGKGTGLGLPMVYGTVKAHLGRMSLQSSPGRGTTVSILLPATHLAGTPDLPSGTGATMSSACLSILLVDDDVLMQASLSAILGRLGHYTTVMGDGESALNYLASGGIPDLVILDLNMPGMGGAAALRLLRASHPELPVLIATGRADQEAMDLLRELPGVRLMPKPFTLDDVRQNLELYCGV